MTTFEKPHPRDTIVFSQRLVLWLDVRRSFGPVIILVFSCIWRCHDEKANSWMIDRFYLKLPPKKIRTNVTWKSMVASDDPFSSLKISQSLFLRGRSLRSPSFSGGWILTKIDGPWGLLALELRRLVTCSCHVGVLVVSFVFLCCSQLTDLCFFHTYFWLII